MLSESCHASVNEGLESTTRENKGAISSEDTGLISSTTLSSSRAASPLVDEENPLSSLIPVIPHCEEFKYYRAPEGLKRLRNKRKVALLFAYIGERYCGLQWNHLPQFPTVEEAILKALFEADMISLTNISNVKVQQLLNFERASRTDKGVHALCNVISVNLMLPYDPEYVQKELQRLADKGSNPAKDEQEGEEEDEVGVVTGKTSKTEKVTEVLQNETSPAQTPSAEQTLKYSLEEGKRVLRRALPKDIHLYDIVPVTRSFNAYLCCGGRRYEYFLPTFALLTPQEYSETYFPVSVAPSSPNLKEVGFKLGKNVPSHRKQQLSMAQDGMVPCSNALVMEDGREGRTSTSGSPSSGRRSKGHFPKSKKRRLQYAEKKEERLLAEKEAARQAENEDDRKRRKEESSPLPSVQVPARDGMPTQPQGNEREELNQERIFKKEHCAISFDEEKDNTEEENEKITEMSVDTDDPSAVEAFLSTHRATHFHDHLFESMILFRTIPPETMKQVAKYRISASQLEHIRSLFHLYEGTHCYHNFTPGGRSTDASCHRYVKSITVGEPILWKPGDAMLEESIEKWTPSRFFAPDEQLTEACEEAREEVHMADASGSPSCGNQEKVKKMKKEEDTKVRDKLREHLRQFYPDGIEVVRIELDGQSFMLNQIRKMIGAAIGITVAGLPPSFLLDTLLRKGVHQPIPMVPANGLLLSYLDFSGYGNRLTRIQRNGANGAGKEGIDMEALMPPQEVEEQERRTASVILRNEMGSDLMGKWMRSLRHAIRLAWKKEIP